MQGRKYIFKTCDRIPAKRCVKIFDIRGRQARRPVLLTNETLYTLVSCGVTNTIKAGSIGYSTTSRSISMGTFRSPGCPDLRALRQYAIGGVLPRDQCVAREKAYRPCGGRLHWNVARRSVHHAFRTLPLRSRHRLSARVRRDSGGDHPLTGRFLAPACGRAGTVRMRSAGPYHSRFHVPAGCLHPLRWRHWE